MADAPRFKKDYPGKTVRLNTDAAEDRCGLFESGIKARIDRRVKARDTKLGPWPLPGDDGEWWLRLSLCCSLCGHTHEAFVPEAWIAQGLIVFLDEE